MQSYFIYLKVYMYEIALISAYIQYISEGAWS